MVKFDDFVDRCAVLPSRSESRDELARILVSLEWGSSDPGAYLDLSDIRLFYTVRIHRNLVLSTRLLSYW